MTASHIPVGRWRMISRTMGVVMGAGALLVACRGGDGPLVPEARREAKSGPAAATGEVIVSSTTPATAPQDTTLDVTIRGSGFGTGARAVWSLNGDTSLVHVKATKVVSSTQLVATIIVPLSAPVASYSIMVALPGGKKGVGAELFEITPADPAADFTMDNTLAVRSDAYVPSVYRRGLCGVYTRIYLENGGGDAYMQTDNPRHQDRKCTGYPRKVLIDYGDGATGGGTIINVNSLATATFDIPVGESRMRGLNIADIRCGGLRWKARLQDGVTVPADSVIVTRVDEATFVVQSQPFPNNRAWCIGLQKSFNIAVGFTIRASRPF